MKKLAYGMLFGMSLLVGCEPPKETKPAAPPVAEEKAAAMKPDDMTKPATEPAAEPATEPDKK